MADANEILYHKQRRGVLITLNRPAAMNAATRPMLRKLGAVLDDAVADLGRAGGLDQESRSPGGSTGDGADRQAAAPSELGQAVDRFHVVRAGG